MLHAVSLWNPVRAALGVTLLTAFLLGMVHGITPDEHTWPITFSYAIGSYSTRGGLRAGLTFSLAFTLQRALASELAYLGLSRFLTYGSADYLVYLVVGAVMAWAGLHIVRRGWTSHLHIRFLDRFLPHHPVSESSALPQAPEDVRDPRPWMPAVHGFIAGWGFGAFALIIYTVLAPAMPSPLWGWVPGALFGLGTTLVQALAGALFGWWSTRKGLPPEAIRQIALVTAASTLTWGGAAFMVGGLFGLLFPSIAGKSWDTGIRVHNLDTLGLPLILVLVTVFGIGMTTLVRQTRLWSRRFQRDAPAGKTVN